jgi:hypothetical protein
MKVEMPKTLNQLNLTRSKNVATEIFLQSVFTILTARQKMSFSSSEKHKKIYPEKRLLRLCSFYC